MSEEGKKPTREQFFDEHIAKEIERIEELCRLGGVPCAMIFDLGLVDPSSDKGSIYAFTHVPQDTELSVVTEEMLDVLEKHLAKAEAFQKPEQGKDN